ncbi:uncharacterized protein LOC128338974 [Hemicordylus capensis]|uniref:uncharacterized protein LOC128338974 n=1 Tax=Hemicordylus capensis TaxID=884348 RepID=UPI002303DDDD|nr:uncharacterized protein LOC128338974 [Hemicordylus capensis]XP_053138274.1 uncharacterized protein LOC128338974 [Hemicordylus capensis]XP_053138275.1 uncharacterized protein LOC128338974 [Hemicordylus capensis]XP_053138276.1 uncharacterized protein LOC128338974 [Hemicordylus capensis]XP_053138277.1 uncharacterized protein LOC128338974 [Hemicordylus capensis]
MAMHRMIGRKKCILALVGLLLLSAGLVLPCPQVCQLCSVYATECEQISSLPAVLATLPSYTEKIVLQHGNLSEIPPLSFRKFHNLHFLSLNGFLITSLSDLAFSTFPLNSLRSLDLSNNQLLSCMIHPMAFSGLLFLSKLTLTNNSLDILRRSWFSEMPVLTKLFLSANKILYLPPRMFENLTKLNELVVSSNLIQYLPMDTFYGLPSLTKLDLSSNKILFVNREVFQPLRALKYLLLFQNRLTILPSLPGSVAFLFLHGNPWECSCQMAMSMETLSAKIQTPDGVVCDRPPSLAGRQVTSARPDGCSPPSSSSPSSSMANAPPPKVMYFTLLYGVIGGVFIGLIVCLICCCCVPKCMNGIRSKSRKKDKPSFVSEWTGAFSGEMRPASTDSQILYSFPVVENSALAFEAGSVPRETSAGHFGSRIYKAEQARATAQRPLVALLSVDKTTGKAFVRLCERGDERWYATLDQPRSQIQEESTQRLGVVSGGAGAYGMPEQSFARGEHCFCGCREATSDPVKRMPCVLGKCLDTSLAGQRRPPARLHSVQLPQTLVHIDIPDGRAIKIKRDGALVCDSSSSRSGFHVGASHGRPRHRLPSGNPALRDEARFSSSRCVSETRLWRESSAERRRPKCTVRSRDQKYDQKRRPKRTFRSRESLRKTEIYAKDYAPLLHEGNRKPKKGALHDHHPVLTPDRGSSSSSATSSSLCGICAPRNPCIKMLSVAHRSLKRESPSQLRGNAARERSVGLERSKVGHRPQEEDLALTRDASIVERSWRCQRCGFEESHSCTTAQRAFAQRKAGPTASEMQADAASQWGYSDTVHRKGRKAAVNVFGLHQNAEKSLLEGLPKSSCPSAPPPPFGVPHPGQTEDDQEAAYEYPSLLENATATSEAKRLLRGTGAGFPLSGHTPTKLILKEQEGAVKVMKTMTAVDHAVDAFPQECGSAGRLAEDLLAAGVPLGMVACDVGEPFVEGLAEWVSVSPDVTPLGSGHDVSSGLPLGLEDNPLLLEPPISGQSSSRLSFSGVGYEEVAAITSSCPLVQEMCQIHFPLPVEEEKASQLEEEEEEENAMAVLFVGERTVCSTHSGLSECAAD